MGKTQNRSDPGPGVSVLRGPLGLRRTGAAGRGGPHPAGRREAAEPFDWEPVALTTTAQGETCFVLSPQEFIQRYNSLFRAQWGEDMLPPLAQWMDYGTEEPSGAGGGHQYVSLMDESNYAEPFLSLWVTQNGKRVMETVTGVSQKNYEEGAHDAVSAQGPIQLAGLFPRPDRGGLPGPV